MENKLTFDQVIGMFSELSMVSKYAFNNYYLMMVEKDFILNNSQWFKMWDEFKEGYYQIAGNKVFVVESSLNRIIDITDKME